MNVCMYACIQITCKQIMYVSGSTTGLNRLNWSDDDPLAFLGQWPNQVLKHWT